MHRFLAIPLLLLPVVVHSELNFWDEDNLIPKWLPQCFRGFDVFDPFGVLDCIRDNTSPQCWEETSLLDTLEDAGQCINDSIGDDVADLVDGQDTSTTVEGFLSDVFNVAEVFVNGTLDCLDPYVDCVNETIQTAISTNLNSCLNTTLRSFIECGRVNNETCLTSCQENLPAGTTFVQLEGIYGVNAANVVTCSQIQSNIMDPICDVVDCCEPCVQPLEELMDCLVNEQLSLVPVSGAECELTCPEPQRRHRHLLRDQTGTKNTDRPQRRKLQSTTTTGEDCLQFAPGLTGDDAAEFAARTGIFLECSYDTFVAVMDEEEADITSDNDNEMGTGTGLEDEEEPNEEQNSNVDEGTGEEVDTSSGESLVGSIGFVTVRVAVLSAVLFL